MPILVWSDDDAALDASVVGTKFATLASVGRWPEPDRPAMVPGAALGTDAWRRVITHGGLLDRVRAAVAGDAEAAAELCTELGAVALPDDVERALQDAVQRLGSETALAVRSSAVAEDLVGRSFAGQYESRLGVVGADAVASAYRACLASAWRPGAMAYRRSTESRDDDPAMAVALQPMAHDGDGWAGAALSDGSGGLVVEVVRGWGDALMSGRADPLRWELAADDTPDDHVPAAVASWVRRAERRVGSAVEVEFAVRRGESVPVVLQLRAHAVAGERGAPGLHTSAGGVVRGIAVGSGRVRGPVCRLDGVHEMDRMVPGGVLVTSSTDPGWVPLLAQASAVVTDHGGSTSHAAIVCRELGLLAVVGCGDATAWLAHGREVEVRCDGSTGSVLLS